MQVERNKIIRYALDFNIEDVNTYSGYKGDLIVKITTKDKDVVIAIRKYAISLGVEDVVVKHNPNLVLYELYCVTANEAVYHIKIEDLMHDINSKS